MFRWLFRWRHPNRDDCFCYYDGFRWRRVDPLVAARTLEAECPEYGELFALLSDDAPAVPGPVGADLRQQRDDALVKLVAAARKMFGLAPLSDTGGVTEGAVFRALGDFLLWLEAAAEDARPFLTSRPRASPSTPPDSPAASSAGFGTAAG
jgi:hypothetical protein